MWRFLYRQRRRILFSALTFTAMVLLLVAGEGVRLGGLSPAAEALAWAATALILCVGAAVAVALMLLLLPKIRVVWEQAALSGFATLVVIQLFPWPLSWPVVGPVIPFFVMFFFINLIWGAMLDRFRLWVDHRETARFTSEKSAEELWSLLLPTSKGYWDPLLHDLRPDPDDPDTFEVEYRLGLSTYEHQTITMLDRSFPRHFKYHFQGEIDAGNRALAEGTYEVTLTPSADGAPGCQVEIVQRREQMLLRLGLLQWFDDALRSSVDHLRAREHNLRDWSTTGLIRRQILALS